MKLSDQKNRLETALSGLPSFIGVYVALGSPSILVVSVEDEDELAMAEQIAASVELRNPVEVELHVPRTAVALNRAG